MFWLTYSLLFSAAFVLGIATAGVVWEAARKIGWISFRWVGLALFGWCPALLLVLAYFSGDANDSPAGVLPTIARFLLAFAAGMIAGLIFFPWSVRRSRRTQEEKPRRRPFRRALLVWMGAVALVLVVMIPADWSNRAEMARWDAEFESFLEEHRQEPPAGENAADIYLRVGEQANEGIDWAEAEAVEDAEGEERIAGLDAFCQKHADLLRELEQAADLEECVFPGMVSGTWVWSCEEGEVLNSVRYLVLVPLRLAVARADREQILMEIARLRRHDQHFASHQSVIGLLFRAHLCRLILRDLQEILRHSPQTAAELAGAFDSYRPMENLDPDLQAELRYFERYLYLKVYTERDPGAAKLMGLNPETIVGRGWSGATWRFFVRVFFVHDALVQRHDFLAELREIAHGREEEFQRQFAGAVLEFHSRPVNAPEMAIQAQSSHAVLCTAFAAAEYHGRHGEYPQRFTDFPEDVQQRLPRDPTDGRAIRLLPFRGGLAIAGIDRFSWERGNNQVNDALILLDQAFDAVHDEESGAEAYRELIAWIDSERMPGERDD